MYDSNFYDQQTNLTKKEEFDKLHIPNTEYLERNFYYLKNIYSELENYNMVGPAIDKLKSDFESSLKTYEKTIEDIIRYKEILKLNDELIKVDDELERVESSITYYQSLSPETQIEKKEQNAEISRLSKEKRELLLERQKLREKILKLFSLLGLEPPKEIEIVTTYTWDDIVDLSKTFQTLWGTKNIFKEMVKKGIYSSEEEAIKALEDKFSNIRNKYNGNEQTYYLAMEVIEACLVAGARVPYIHAGTTVSGKTEDTRNPVPVDTAGKGIDCNALASLLLYGDDSYSSWLSVSQFNNAGEQIEKYEALPGDFFTTEGHVGIIIANNPETNEMAILHASGSDGDLKFEIVNYDGYLVGKNIRRIDSTYNTEYMQTQYNNEFKENYADTKLFKINEEKSY